MTSKNRKQRRAGQCYTSDFQSDVYGGAYTLIERTGPNTWTCVNLPPSEAEIAAILTDPWNVEHGDAERVLAERWARWGIPYTVTFVSASRYASYF